MTAHAKPLTDRSGDLLLADLDAARDRCEVNDTIARWCLELRSRLERAEDYLLHPDCRRHHAALDAEIERFKLCVQLAKARAS